MAQDVFDHHRDDMCDVALMLTIIQVVKHYRRIKKKPPPKLPAPPRKKSASDDATQLTLPSYIPPCSVKPGAVPYADKLAPLQLYAALQLVVEGSDGMSCVKTRFNFL
jgi:hypothetical protein